MTYEALVGSGLFLVVGTTLVTRMRAVRTRRKQLPMPSRPCDVEPRIDSDTHPVLTENIRTIVAQRDEPSSTKSVHRALRRSGVNEPCSVRRVGRLLDALEDDGDVESTTPRRGRRRERRNRTRWRAAA